MEGGSAMAIPLSVGACTYSWLWSDPLEHAVHRIADLGFRYFEFMTTPPHCWPRDWSAADRRAFRTLYESRGLRLVSVNPTYLDLNLASPNPGFREESIRQLRETIQLAHDIGAGIVVAPVGRKHGLLAPGQPYLRDLVKRALEMLLGDCEKLGVTFGLENAYTVIHTATEMIRMCRDLSHPNLKLVYDVANATMVESPLDGLELVASDLALLHVSDTDAKVWGHARLGTGVIDFAAVTAKITKIGHAGPTILEIVDGQAPDESNRASLDYLKALGWRP
jgi:sugar phosphate isomerase/epimerase